MLFLDPQDVLPHMKGKDSSKAYLFYGREGLIHAIVRELKTQFSWDFFSLTQRHTLFSPPCQIHIWQEGWENLLQAFKNVEQGILIAYGETPPPDSMKSHPWVWVPCYKINSMGVKTFLERWAQDADVSLSPEALSMSMRHDQWFILHTIFPLFAQRTLHVEDLELFLPKKMPFSFQARFWQGLISQALLYKQSQTDVPSGIKAYQWIMRLMANPVQSLQEALWVCQKLTRSVHIEPFPPQVCALLTNVLQNDHEIFRHP